MITRIEAFTNRIIDSLIEKPQNREMSLWLKRVACIATIWAIVYSAILGSNRCVILFTIALTAWFVDSEVSAHIFNTYVDFVCIGVVTGVVLTVVLYGDLGQIGCFIALTIAVLSVFILGLLWGNILGLFSCLFVAIVFSVNKDNRMADIYSKEFCDRFIYIMLSFMATVNFIVYGMTDYWIYKREYRKNLATLIDKGKSERKEVYLKILIAMYKTLESKSPAMARHSERTAEWTKMIARKMGVHREDELKNYYYAGLLHDIGKIGIPDKFMDRADLTDEEYQIYKKHVDIGYDILKKIDIEDISNAALYHHEKWKGDGYKGLRGDEIPQIARIVGVANYLTRLEEQGKSLKEMREDIKALGGKAYDVRIVGYTCEVIDELIAREKERMIWGQSVY